MSGGDSSQDEVADPAVLDALRLRMLYVAREKEHAAAIKAMNAEHSAQAASWSAERAELKRRATLAETDAAALRKLLERARSKP